MIAGQEAWHECHQLEWKGDEGSCQAELAVYITDSTFKKGRFHVIFVLAIRPTNRDLWERIRDFFPGKKATKKPVGDAARSAQVGQLCWPARERFFAFKLPGRGNCLIASNRLSPPRSRR